MRIAIVNDMPMAAEALRRVLALAPEHRLAWIAGDGAEAVDLCARDRPDLVLMD
jgi:two-component system response regulator WspF